MQTIAHFLFGMLYGKMFLKVTTADALLLSLFCNLPDIDLDLTHVIPKSPHKDKETNHAVWTHTLVFVCSTIIIACAAKRIWNIKPHIPYSAIVVCALSHLVLDCVTYSGHCHQTSRHIYFWPLWGQSFHLDCLIPGPELTMKIIREGAECVVHIILWALLFRTIVRERKDRNNFHQFFVASNSRTCASPSLSSSSTSSNKMSSLIPLQPQIVLSDHEQRIDINQLAERVHIHDGDDTIDRKDSLIMNQSDNENVVTHRDLLATVPSLPITTKRIDIASIHRDRTGIYESCRIIWSAQPFQFVAIILACYLMQKIYLAYALFIAFEYTGYSPPSKDSIQNWHRSRSIVDSAGLDSISIQSPSFSETVPYRSPTLSGLSDSLAVSSSAPSSSSPSAQRPESPSQMSLLQILDSPKGIN